MTKEFDIALEVLYNTFATYPLNSTIEGCPCCVSDTDKSTLHSKQLKELENEDISRYAFKAMTTWGVVNDFKHYLPRIFELAAKRKLIVDTFVILGKLEYGNWINWNQTEQDAIKKFLIAWWTYDINTSRYFNDSLFLEIQKLLKDIPVLLNKWNLELDSQGFKNFVELIDYHYYDLNHKSGIFKKLTKYELDLLLKWIKSNSNKLEEGFFEFERKDKEFAERVSNTLYMFERI